MARVRPAHLASTVWLLVSCAGGQELSMSAIDDRVAFVGSTLAVEVDLAGAGPDAQLAFWTDAPNVCQEGRCRAGFERVARDRAVFRWVPRAADVGRHRFRFAARDGSARDTERFEVEVRSSVGYAGLPRFVQPLGTGTTLDFGRDECFELDVVVDDPDSRGVTITQVPPLLEGATLEERDSFAASWRWCPTPDQLRGGDHRRLLLAADDGENPTTEKSFLLVMRRDAKPDCEGRPPDIEVAHAEVEPGGDVRIEARVDAQYGVKHTPLLYWSTVRPADDPELSRLTQAAMELVSGDRFDGLWVATIPDPSEAIPAGASIPLHYAITATTSSEDGSPCDFHGQAPEAGTFEIELTGFAPGERPDVVVDACAPCSRGRACGNDAECVGMGVRGQSFCLPTCERDADCPSDATCPATEVDTVGGARARVCIPDAGTCVSDPDGCADDRWEDNDSYDAVVDARPLGAGEHDELRLCRVGGDLDEDWYRLEIAEESRLLVDLRGSSTTDLDLGLLDADGTVRAVAESMRSEEAITACVEAGTHFVRVYGFGEGANDYRLRVQPRGATCEAECRPDRDEEDDDSRRARRARLTPEYVSSGNTVCSGDDDWYAVELEAGQTLGVELTFVQTSPEEDLDLHFYDMHLEDWTPCSEADPSRCSAFQGQSVDSNEYYDVTVEETGTHYVVVHGFDGAENDYDIRLWILKGS